MNGTRSDRTFSLFLIGTFVFATGRAVLAWDVQHNDASRLGATIAPEPFKSNADLCVHGTYPDSLPDHAISCHEEIYLRRLFTFEAIEALRAGDVPKAMFIASAATHFLTDYCCIAHSTYAWYHDGNPNGPWARFLPRKYQNLRVPRVVKQVYYPHLKGTAKDNCLDLPEPMYNIENWRKFQGSINAYFDTLPSVRGYITPEMLRRPTNWTATDYDQFARWYGNFIALDMLDPQSLTAPPFRLRDAAGMKAVNIEEVLNATAQCAAYYGYLCTAAKTQVSPALEQLLPEHDKLLTPAKGRATVAIADKAPWPVERAANVLAMELLRAERRLATQTGGSMPEHKISDYVTRLSEEHALEGLKDHSVILILTSDNVPLVRAMKVPELPAGARGLITVEKSGDSGQGIRVTLRGASRQDTLYLVDYLLDLCDAPLNGPWPAERVVEAVKRLWPGWQFLLDLRKMGGEAVVPYAYKFAKNRPPLDQEAANRVREELRNGPGKPSGQDEWWARFLLEMPLPDGRRVPEMIGKGTDYSALLQVVNRNP